MKMTVEGFMMGREAARIIPCLFAALLLWGCSPSGETSRPRFPAAADSAIAAPPPPPEENAPSPRDRFGYLVQNDDCRCAEFTTVDPNFPVSYRFEASYRMQGGFITSIKIRFDNRSADTLFLDRGAVMVSSKNIDYQYNNKFIPLPDMTILPGNTEDLDLDGKEVTSSPTWKKIAGEKLTLTLKGLKLGETTLGKQVVTFVPENPMLRDDD